MAKNDKNHKSGDIYLQSTTILDYNSPNIQLLSKNRYWIKLPTFERIGAIYNFIRDEIKFGYNTADDIPASQVLEDGYGQCNTKASLLMALFRLNNIQCRFHGFTIHKALQKGAITGIWYNIAPENIIHSWVEIKYKNRWINLEGFILDKPYLAKVQTMNPGAKEFSGYGCAVPDLRNPQVDWQGDDTYIQKEGINNDFGIFNSPNEFYKKHGSNLNGFKKFLYANMVRKFMNNNVTKVRTINSKTTFFDKLALLLPVYLIGVVTVLHGLAWMIADEPWLLDQGPNEILLKSSYVKLMASEINTHLGVYLSALYRFFGFWIFTIGLLILSFLQVTKLANLLSRLYFYGVMIFTIIMLYSLQYTFIPTSHFLLTTHSMSLAIIISIIASVKSVNFQYKKL